MYVIGVKSSKTVSYFVFFCFPSFFSPVTIPNNYLSGSFDAHRLSAIRLSTDSCLSFFRFQIYFSIVEWISCVVNRHYCQDLSEKSTYWNTTSQQVKALVERCEPTYLSFPNQLATFTLSSVTQIYHIFLRFLTVLYEETRRLLNIPLPTLFRRWSLPAEYRNFLSWEGEREGGKDMK